METNERTDGAKNCDCVMIGDCVCEKQPDGSIKLLRYTGSEENAVIPSEITSVAENAFLDCSVLSVTLKGAGLTIWFPKSHSYYLKKMLEGFGKNGRIFDFEEYDRFLLGDHFNDERIKMLRGRICGGYDITVQTRERLIANMRTHEEQVIEAVTEQGSEETLEDLAACEFFSEENIDSCIERVNQTSRKELLGWLMNYKHEKFQPAEFDFSI